MANEVIIPPDILPESPVGIELVDDQTSSFRPMFGRNWAQRNSYADPRWQFKLRFRGLRQSDQARMHAVASEAQGGYRTVMASPYQANRGSFATTYAPELFTNADFSNGTTGWTGDFSSLASNDGVLRLTATSVVASIGARQSITTVAYAPYAVRSVILAGKGFSGLSFGPCILDGVDGATSLSATRGYRVASYVTEAVGPGSDYPALCGGSSGFLVGDYIDIPFASLARCALVDGGGNLLLQSNTLANASWTKATQTAAGNNGTSDPNGGLNAQFLFESDNVSREHYVAQAVTVSSTATDITLSAYAKAQSRNWLLLRMQESSGATYVYQWFNVAAGTIGTPSAGANWSNIRATIGDAGSGWYRCTLTARKTNAATSISAIIQCSNADNVTTYAGVASTTALVLYEINLQVSGVPTRGSSTTSVALASAAQSGSGIYVKGLPASQNKLLGAGDWFELDGQLKRCTSALNSDAAGTGYLQFRPKIYRAVADNTPIIVTKPTGRFILPENVSLDAMFGLNSDYTITLQEIYE